MFVDNSGYVNYTVDGAELVRLITMDEYREDPVRWVKEKASAHPYSKQQEILRSVRDNQRTLVVSSHTVGKSWLSAHICAWWVDTHLPDEVFFVTTAPTAPQVKTIIFRELPRVHAAAKLPGRLNQTEWYVQTAEGEKLVGIGRKPNDLNQAAFQGIHAPYVLLVMDEAYGISESLWVAGETLIHNDDCRWLAIGNPGSNKNSMFYKAHLPGSGWNVIKVTAFDTPNFTGEPVPVIVRRSLVSVGWVEDKKVRWGEESPLYRAKVLAEFPDESSGGLISVDLIRNAQIEQDPMIDDSRSSGLAFSDLVFGVDLGAGTNRTVVIARAGVDKRTCFILYESRERDTMLAVGAIYSLIAQYRPRAVFVDPIGIGRVIDRLQEVLNENSDKTLLVGASFASWRPEIPASSPHAEKRYTYTIEAKSSFNGFKVAAFFALKDLFVEGGIALYDPEDSIASDLIELRYRIGSSGKVSMVPKKELVLSMDGESPDYGDALCYANLEVVEAAKPTKATWGR